jgi:hypothetical protein
MVNVGSIGKIVVAGTMASIATLMTMGLVKTTMDGFYQVKGSSKKLKDVEEVEKELNRLGHSIK